MLIDATQTEETRVVVLDGNKLEDVEFETSHRRQIKGNIYLGKVMRVEPSLQACFVDYGGNKHGFLAFGEIHPDYYDLTEEELEAVEKEVDEIIENKKQAIKEREAERERIRQEKAAARAAREAERARLAAEAEEAAKVEAEANTDIETKSVEQAETIDTDTESAKEVAIDDVSSEQKTEEKTEKMSESEQASDLNENTNNEDIATILQEETDDKKHPQKKRLIKKRIRKQEEAKKAAAKAKNKENEKAEKEENLKVLAEDTGCEEAVVKAEVEEEIDEHIVEAKQPQNETFEESEDADFEEKEIKAANNSDDDDEDVDDDDNELDFELQRKLIRARKLFHRHKIQDVIKEGQTVLVQVVKEERGNKGAALTTYLSLAGRYCVLMPNRIKSGGVSRKITNATDRNRLKGIVRELPLTSDMSIIVRTAGEEKPKSEIVRDYNYLIRTWNQIRLDSLKNKVPSLVHEEGNLIKRALRDIYTKEVSEIIVAGEDGYKLAKDFFKILSPHNLKKIKSYRNADMPLFQRFQVEGQLDKLHDANAQLESGGYLVINPTEALVSIDVNSGRATKEKDLEETALKTNLEACDEIARQLRMRNLAGLVVIDFIDMDEPANNHAVEKRMKEALKKDRSRIQVGKMSMFGLLELSRQRMHSAFWESNYQTCPHCQGKGIVRTVDSSAMYILRAIEEEGIKGRSSKINVFLPTETAIYILNHKRKTLVEMEQKYKMEIVVSADDSIKCISNYKIERTKLSKEEKAAMANEDKKSKNEEFELPEPQPELAETTIAEEPVSEEKKEEKGRNRGDRRHGRNRFDRRRGRFENRNTEDNKAEKTEAVILYDSHEDTNSKTDAPQDGEVKEKSTWWKKLIKG